MAAKKGHSDCSGGREGQVADAELAGQHEHLEELVRARTAELEAANARLQAEIAERKQNEEHFRALAQAGSDVVYRMNSDWAEMRRVVGRDFIADTEEPSQTWLQKYIHPDDQPQVLAAINEAIHTKSVFTLEHRVLRVDGTLGWTSSRAIPLLDDSGEIFEWFGIASDITERKQAEEALQESDARYRALVYASPDAIFICRNKTSILANPAALRLFGFKDNYDFFHTPVVELFHPDSQSSVQQRIAQLLVDDAKSTHEDRIICTDGQIRDVETTAVSLLYRQKHAVQFIVRDITERKQYERKLATDISALTRMHELSGKMLEIAELSSLLQVAMEAAVAILDADKGTLQLVDGDTLKIVAQHGHAQPFLDFFSAAEQVASVCGEATRQRKRVVIEDVNQSPLFLNTASLPVFHEARVRAVQSTPLFTHTGRLLGILTTQWSTPHIPDEHDLWRLDLLAWQVSDLIEHKQVEDALRESEERHRQVVDNTTAIILRVDPQGVIRFANQRALDFFGYTADELLGRHANDTIVPPRETTGRDLTAMVAQIVADPDQFHSNANENICKNGERVWIEWTNSGIYDADGRLQEFLSVGIDATKRKQVEEALHAERQKLINVLEMLPVMICLLTPDFHVAYANLAFRQQFGEANGRHCYDYCCGFDQPCSFCEAMVPLQTGQPHHWEFISPDGNTIIDAYDFPFTDTDGSPLILEMDIDITERILTEKALREADRAKDEFLAVLSHELQTPLTSMLGWSAEALLAGTPEMLATAMPIVHRNALRQKRLVQDLLDMSRLIHDKIELTSEPLDLGAQVVQAVENIRHLFEERQLQLAFVPSPEPLPILADKSRIQQCLGNLLNNSVKFTPAGGTITVRYWRSGDQALCSVEDTGRGIPADALPTIFQAFRQVERNENYGGLGLGLAVTHGIIALHGGNITAESDGPDCGSRFTISLPLSEVEGG